MASLSAKNKILVSSALAFIFVVPGFSQSGSALSAPFRTITIAAEPNAIVWVDGVRYGVTAENGKLEIRTITSGVHTLRVLADGFTEKSQPLTAVQKGEVKVSLVKTDDPAELAYQDAERQSAEDREKAAEAYRRAIKARANYPEAYLGLGRVLLGAGKPDEASKALAAARRLRPGYAEASAVEGRVHQGNGDEAKAIAAFKRSITEGKGFQPEAHTGLGLLYKDKAEGAGGTGDFAGESANYAEATRYLTTAVKQLSGSPDASVIYQLIGLIYEKQNKPAEAIAVYEEFLRFFPDSTDATAVRSFIVQLKKDMAP